MYLVMRKLPGYTWETMLKERVPRTIISAELISKENKINEKSMKKRKK